jgi:hypothetical protein
MKRCFSNAGFIVAPAIKGLVIQIGIKSLKITGGDLTEGQHTSAIHPRSHALRSLRLTRVAHLAHQDHGVELLEVLRTSIPTPRGQEAQLDQVIKAHWIAPQGRVDNASGKEEDDQNQFGSGPGVLGLDPVAEAAKGGAE